MLADSIIAQALKMLDFRSPGHPLNRPAAIDNNSSINQGTLNIAGIDNEVGARTIVEPEPMTDTAVDAPFWMSVSLRTGFRRLHRRGGCWYTASRVENVQHLAAVEHEAKCDVCFSKRQPVNKRPLPIDSDENDSVATSDETSSTAST